MDKILSTNEFKYIRGEFKLTVSATRAMCNFQWKRIGCDLKQSNPLCFGVHSRSVGEVKRRDHFDLDLSITDILTA